MEAVEQAFINIPRPKMRKVWVLNSYHLPWSEEFQGNIITIPPNNEKKVMMNYIEARHFVTQMSRPPSIRRPDGTFEGQPKALRTEELTESDLAKIGKTREDLKAKVEEEEATAKASCPICGQYFKSAKGVSIHCGSAHPEYESVKEENDSRTGAGLSTAKT